MPDGATPLIPSDRPTVMKGKSYSPPDHTNSWGRHLWQLIPVGLLTALAGWALGHAVPLVSLAAVTFDLLCLLNFILLAHGAWHSVLGATLALLPARLGPRPYELARAAPSGGASTAVLMPVFAEDAARVAAAVGVMRRSLARAQAGHIDLFVLSDTRDEAHAARERTALASLPAEGISVHYRRRPFNGRRKAGNLMEWCERWGAAYDFMVVLDADSLITGDAAARLIGAMEANPRAGMIQAMCWPVGHTSLFARVLQASARLNSSLSVRGLAFWQGPRGSWWGHNAIIRTDDFMRHCCLPDLPGRAPLGGEILCHDTVEAAMLVRAGREVWLITDTEGSYEEVPTNLIDFLVRERRWCQGNLQHAGVLARSDGLPIASCLHIFGGFLHYAMTPLTLVLVVLISSWGSHLFNGRHILMVDWGWVLGGVTLVLVYLPKLLSVMLVLWTRGAIRAYGGFIGLLASVALEQVFGYLLGPVILLFILMFVTDTLAGKSVSWATQNRHDRNLSWREAWTRLGWPSILATVAVTALASVAEPSWIIWSMLPGFLLAVPFAVFTGRRSWGEAAARLNLFVTPDETSPAPELLETRTLLQSGSGQCQAGLVDLPPEQTTILQRPAGFRRTHSERCLQSASASSA